MPGLNDFADRLASAGPRSFWEAVGTLSRIQDEQAIAIRAGDLGKLNRLLSEQAIAWAHARAFVLELVARGEAPLGMVERLRQITQVHKDREGELLEAQERLRAKLEDALRARQSASEESPPTALAA